MGLISGSVACTRFNIVSLPEEIDFDLVPFRPIMPGSTHREREGFVPFEPEAPYEAGVRRWAFRIRIDKVTLDATAVRERLKELIKAETEAVGPPSPKTRQKLKQMAEDEMMQHPMPRSKIIECILEETVLYVGTASKTQLGTVLELLKRIGVEVDFKTPWMDAGQEDQYHENVEIKEPGQSVWGARFLKALLNDPDVLVEPEKGSVKLITADGAKVSLAGAVLNELDRLLESGSEVLSSKLMMDEFQFGLDALGFRLTGVKLDNIKGKHWTEVLELRMDKLKELWEALDDKYQKFKEKEEAGQPVFGSQPQTAPEADEAEASAGE